MALGVHPPPDPLITGRRPSRASAAIGLALAAMAGACGESEPSPSDRPAPDPVAQPLSARLDVRGEGTAIAPFTATLDATASTGGQAPLRFRFDVDGDGRWEGDWSESATWTHRYDDPGRYRPRVEVQDGDGEIASAEAALRVSPEPNRPPVAALSARPMSGTAPLTVALSAAASEDPDGRVLTARFDWEGDGTFDTDFSDALDVTHTYVAPGEYRPEVEVRDADGATHRAGLDAPIVATPGPRILADFDRDGIVSDADLAAHPAAALCFANLDDDDADGDRDADDDGSNGPRDRADLTPLRLGHYPGLDPQATVELRIEPRAAAQRARLLAGPRADQTVIAPGRSTGRIDTQALIDGDVPLWLELNQTRSPSFDGRLKLTMRISQPDGTEASADAHFELSALLFPSNLDPARLLYLVSVNGFGRDHNRAFISAVEKNLPDSVELHVADGGRVGEDVWIQDSMQTGHQTRPGPEGLEVMDTYLNTARFRAPFPGLDNYLPNELLAPDLGYHQARGRHTGLNYGGNLEIAPPYETDERRFPFGQILVGGGDEGLLDGYPYEDHMNSTQRGWLDAQAQGPSFELSSEWLIVGHLDEIFLFIPDLSQSPPGYKVILASPDLALEGLRALAAAGGGQRPVFERRRTETTVDAILTDPHLLAFNDAAQARIDSIRDALAEEMGLQDEDFVEVPVIYEPFEEQGLEFAVAYNPGIQNLVVLNELLVIPDPEGPKNDNAQDIWIEMTEAALAPLGVERLYVDIFNIYHLNLGEAHCGSNVARSPLAPRWWEEIKP